MQELRICKIHGETMFNYEAKSNRWRCIECYALKSKKRRDNFKEKAVAYKGGKCEICGYNTCIAALDFHHINPSAKEYDISTKGYSKNFEVVKLELDKCVLVCANCHREIHYNYTKLETTQFNVDNVIHITIV